MVINIILPFFYLLFLSTKFDILIHIVNLIRFKKLFNLFILVNQYTFFYALAAVSVFAKLFFSLLLLIAIMTGLFYFDEASKRRFFSSWLGYNLLGNFCV